MMLYKIDDRRIRLVRSEVLKDAILRHENVSDFLDLSLEVGHLCCGRVRLGLWPLQRLELEVDEPDLHSTSLCL